MPDLHEEGLLTLSQAAKALPFGNGKRIHTATIWRWCQKGLSGVRLEHVRIGHRICTSMQALSRFSEKLTEAKQLHRAPAVKEKPRRGIRRERATSAAHAKLAAEGIPCTT